MVGIYKSREKECYLNSRDENDVPGTANDVLKTTVEGIPDQNDVETEFDAALEDKLLAEINVSGKSADNHVIYTEVEATNNAVTQYVGDSIDLRNYPF